MLDLDCVATFVQVAACQGFREAAKRSGLSQPAVTQHIKRLEQTLQVSLIERHPGGSRLTPQGKTFLPYAESLLRTAERAQSLFLQDSLAVGASSNTGIYLLQPELKAWQERGGEPVQLRIAANPDIATRLERGEIDVALMEWWDKRPGFVVQVWRSEALVLIVPQSHPWAPLSSIAPSRLVEEPLLGGEPGSGTGRLLQRLLGEQARRLPPSPQLGSTEAVKRAVQAGLGVSLVMASAVEQEVRSGLLKSIAIEGELLRKEILVIRRCLAIGEQTPAARFAQFLLRRPA